MGISRTKGLGSLLPGQFRWFPSFRSVPPGSVQESGNLERIRILVRAIKWSKSLAVMVLKFWEAPYKPEKGGCVIYYIGFPHS